MSHESVEATESTFTHISRVNDYYNFVQKWLYQDYVTRPHNYIPTLSWCGGLRIPWWGEGPRGCPQVKKRTTLPEIERLFTGFQNLLHV